MDTISILTLRLAEAIGLYLILIGISGLASPQRWRGAMEELDRSPGLTLITGLVAFALGATIVMVHRAFADPLGIIVTLVGYVALIKGALLIAVPAPLVKLGHWSFRFTRAWAAFALILGILLFYAGLTGRATVIA
ncbi:MULTISPECIES: DUF2065 family protein [Sphingobium]|jgi:uncharacterized protein YjeT (DUF2065 family)|uniref:DUF2065 domain-containing protein n=1 Tax=Sphingobium baderi TaxID=1332080 RepID=A0A0S3EW26_9SPHN|nr:MULTISPECIES: DUF2065 family protein [Sphingobium]ALR19632.1 hypothetical protein ATN00_04230 [Sphingobium baderi]